MLMEVAAVVAEAAGDGGGGRRWHYGGGKKGPSVSSHVFCMGVGAPLVTNTVLLYETKFQLRNRTTFFWLRLLLPFFFYAIDSVGVYGVGLFPKKTAQKRRRSSVPKLQQAQSGCLCPTGRFKKKRV